MKGIHLTQCLVGMGAAVILLLAFGVQAGTLVYIAAALACPLMMIVMMRAMAGAGDSRDHGDQSRTLDLERQSVERRR